MKFRIFIISLLFCAVSASAQTNNTLIGRTFIADVDYICKKMDDGGCSISVFRILHFKSDSVEISYKVDVGCTNKANESKYTDMYKNLTYSYKYTLLDGILTIVDFKDYSNFILHGTDIFCKNKSENSILFTEQLSTKKE